MGLIWFFASAGSAAGNAEGRGDGAGGSCCARGPSAELAGTYAAALGRWITFFSACVPLSGCGTADGSVCLSVDLLLWSPVVRAALVCFLGVIRPDVVI